MDENDFESLQLAKTRGWRVTSWYIVLIESGIRTVKMCFDLLILSRASFLAQQKGWNTTTWRLTLGANLVCPGGLLPRNGPEVYSNVGYL